MKYFLSSIFILILANNCFASGRYPSGDVTEPNSKADVVCKCDPQNDPCCIPPLGKSSNKTVETDKTKRSDTSTCQCDVNKDPCCKQTEGTKLK
jgi:hypothetical protein